MPLRPLDQPATARLNAIRFQQPAAEVARRLADWQAATAGNFSLYKVDLERLPASPAADKGTQFRDRARQLRARLARQMGLDEPAAKRLTFSIDGNSAWCLGPASSGAGGAAGALAQAAASGTPGHFIRLMLQRELIEAAAFDPADLLVSAGFGPGVYLGHSGQASGRRLHLVEADYKVDVRRDVLLCDLRSKVFLRRKSAAADSASTLMAYAGEGAMVGVTRLVADDFHELDARSHPLPGVSLRADTVRQSRIYYLNLLTEFALALFAKAGIPVERACFTASHCVDDGYLALEPLARLSRPLVVVNATQQSMDEQTLAPLTRWGEFFADGYHVAGGGKVAFEPPRVRLADALPQAFDHESNYLFLNGPGSGEFGSVRTARLPDASRWQPAYQAAACEGLARGQVLADAYTTRKFEHLLDCDTVRVSLQGLDHAPDELAALPVGKTRQPQQRALREALKRCLVEISLKELLLGHKPAPMPALSRDWLPAELTLIATRQVRIPGSRQARQLVAAVDVGIDQHGLVVERVRRSPWSRADEAAIDFVFEFPFLLPEGRQRIRDRQFWVIDRASGDRLTAWAGSFVPRIILNDEYAGIEAALAEQEPCLRAASQTGEIRFYSKGRDFNLLPYYMSMHRRGRAPHGERAGIRIPLQDCGAFVRIFVPPEGGIAGEGDALSAMRDLMMYRKGGETIESGLLDQRLVLIYLHTLSNGLLVGCDNSKMSLLEKLARLALEN